MNEKRKQTILDRYGSFENYEKLRAIKTREKAISRCSSEEEKQQKIFIFNKEDTYKRSVIKERIGKEIECTRCSKLYIANGKQQLYCPKCKMAITRIENVLKTISEEDLKIINSLEEYKKNIELLKLYYKKSSIKSKETRKMLYGSENWNNREKAEITCKERYNAVSPLGVEEFIEKSKDTRFEKYGDEYFNNREKCKKTCLDRYGVDHNWKDKESREKCKQTSIKRYGSVNNTANRIDTCKEKFGGNAPICSTEVHNKIKSTMLEKYGVEYPYQNPKSFEKMKNTMLNIYGYDNIQKLPEMRKRNSLRLSTNPLMHNPETLEKMIFTTISRYGTFLHKSFYKYDNKVFDSSWELAYYIWLIDNNSNFIYKPEPIIYYVENIQKRYLPDFKVNDRYVEIKGNHLISQEGILIDHHGNKYFEKTKCLKDNNVLILSLNEIKPILTYVSKKYGDNYLSSFKYKKEN